MTELTVQILLNVYIGILVLSILIAGTLYSIDRTPAQRTLLLFWIGVTISAFINRSVGSESTLVLFVAAGGTFVSQYFLGAFFGQLHRLKIPAGPIVVVFLIGALCSWILFQVEMPFSIFSFPILVGCSYPLPAHLYQVLRRKVRPLTTVQKAFVVVAVLLSIHYLDWGFFRLRPGLFIYGLSLALVFVSLLATLTPMMANEAMLQRRNEELENEVREQASQLTTVEKKIWEANKMAGYGRMAGGVAHELNTPLQVIELQAEELANLSQENLLTTGEVLSGTKKIQEMVHKISKVTSSLRRLARDQRNVSKETFDLLAVVSNAVGFVVDFATRSGISLDMRVPSETMLIEGSSGEIFQVIVDLLDNAVDAASKLEVREVFIGVRERDGIYEVSVVDSGKIGDDIVPKLMEPFFTTKRIGEGKGLGLSVSRSVAEYHGGALYFDRLSARTRFVLELPKAKG